MIPQMKARIWSGLRGERHLDGGADRAVLPPSHNMIIYSISAGGKSRSPTSSPPASSGLLLAASLMVTAYVVARRRGYPTEAFPGFARVGWFLLNSLPGLL